MSHLIGSDPRFPGAEGLLNDDSGERQLYYVTDDHPLTDTEIAEISAGSSMEIIGWLRAIYNMQAAFYQGLSDLADTL